MLPQNPTEETPELALAVEHSRKLQAIAGDLSFELSKAFSAEKALRKQLRLTTDKAQRKEIASRLKLAINHHDQLNRMYRVAQQEADDAWAVRVEIIETQRREWAAANPDAAHALDLANMRYAEFHATRRETQRNRARRNALSA
jgi:hypothetical protein